MNSRSDNGPGECLTDSLMADYLEGVLTPVVKAACELHLIGCDDCREKLAAFMRILQPDVSPEENQAVEEALAKWEGRDNRPMPHPAKRRTKIVTYGAVAALLVFAVLLSGILSRGSFDELLNPLLTTYRPPFQQRMSSQAWVARPQTRSAASGPFDIVRPEMEKRAQDSYERGLVALLAGEYNTAIEYLGTAAAQSTVAAVRNDLGVAYFNRNRNGDLKLAREQFESALEIDGRFAPAVFNLVLLNDSEGLTSETEQQFERYLKLDANSEWTRELRRHLGKDR